MFAAERDVFRVLFSMAALDPSRSAARSTGWARSAPAAWPTSRRRLAEQEVLRPGITVEDAAHVLWVITSFDSFDLLYTTTAACRGGGRASCWWRRPSAPLCR